MNVVFYFIKNTELIGLRMSLFKENLLSLAKTRLDEAIALFEHKYYSGAYYIAGYSVELNLKARISENFFKDYIPDKKFVNDIYTHDLAKLLGLSGIKREFDDACKNNEALQLNWETIKKWSEIARYEKFDQVEAYSLINAINNQENGFNQWLQNT